MKDFLRAKMSLEGKIVHRFKHYFVATDVYALFLKSFKKIATYMFKTRGRGEGSKAF